MTNFWSWFVILIVAINIIGCVWLLFKMRKNPKSNSQNTTGHSFDGIEELNNPLPAWWMWLFVATIIFSVIYLVLYPGLGNFKGVLNWTSSKQLETEVTNANNVYAPIFANYYKQPITELAKDNQAMESAKRLFVANCAMCHGSDARGAVGFPNLVDGNWMYGNSPEEIEQSILHGRNGVMPPIGAAFDDKTKLQLVAYVRNLNGLSADKEKLAAGEETFQASCAMCHGADAKGNKMLGAPNLTNNRWLYGSSETAIIKTITEGRMNKMPAHESILGKEKVHLLAAYIYWLSHQTEGADANVANQSK